MKTSQQLVCGVAIDSWCCTFEVFFICLEESESGSGKVSVCISECMMNEIH